MENKMAKKHIPDAQRRKESASRAVFTASPMLHSLDNDLDDWEQ
jgi:hypothetical protein